MPARTAAAARQSDGTALRILDITERLVQLRGFNGFSYADVSAELGITKASLHYHFATKAALGEAVVRRYADRFAAALQRIDRGAAAPPTKLNRYAELYAQVLDHERLCLCGMLAAEYDTLPPGMRRAVIQFFDDNERWLAGVLRSGRERGDFAVRGTVAEQARMLLGALEGAMLVARAYRDPQRLRVTARRLVASLAA